ncbi:MAG TPA: peptide chain release factor N(5)-glutamine methyltransferase [Candidatus Synoicihabitans sp.]|nr:peptide chain release factor N(5)-glutamine methyltransferase [Candidatus Synoicihabitans sp.]
MQSVLEILQKTATFLGSRGVENPRLNAELLIGHALGLKRMELYLQFERLLPEAELEKIRPLVRRRAQREPLQYIVGSVDFGGLKLTVDRRALIPRPETEYLLELVAARLGATAPARILDLGTGTGALALALATRYDGAAVVAVDASAGALALASENAQKLGFSERLRFVQSDWFAALPAEPGFDLIVANPPYLAQHDVVSAAPEVREFEPASALIAAEDGLADLRQIVAAAPNYLRPGGLIALETGTEQHPVLEPFVAAAGLEQFESLNDLTERPRFVIARRPG